MTYTSKMTVGRC